MQCLSVYAHALEEINAQTENSVIVAMLEGKVAGVLQLTMISGLCRGGMLRGQIESVRVSSRHRGQDLGKALFEHAIEWARKAGCGLVQLTSANSARTLYGFMKSLAHGRTVMSP